MQKKNHKLNTIKNTKCPEQEVSTQQVHQAIKRMHPEEKENLCGAHVLGFCREDVQCNIRESFYVNIKSY